MGHQVFIIARVKAHGASQATYRCVAGYRHHYCEGDDSLTATLRFLHVLKQPDNADVVREEIRSLDGKYGVPGKDPQWPDMPCGFLSSVVAASWDVIRDGDRLIVDGTWFLDKVVSVTADVWCRRTSPVIVILRDLTNGPLTQRGKRATPASSISQTSSTRDVRSSRATAPELAIHFYSCRNTIRMKWARVLSRSCHDGRHPTICMMTTTLHFPQSKNRRPNEPHAEPGS